jgi:hypothetical protein
MAKARLVELWWRYSIFLITEMTGMYIWIVKHGNDGSVLFAMFFMSIWLGDGILHIRLRHVEQRNGNPLYNLPRLLKIDSNKPASLNGAIEELTASPGDAAGARTL